ncbi:MAG: hypothetical protein MZV64_51930 [Ignavibacteriales bacterium]|nr:hypothetical protein [Ignavibacteriales bacterium]
MLEGDQSIIDAIQQWRFRKS